MSQATVREALLELQHSGLVVRIDNKGTMVTKLSGEEVGERLAIRVPLETIAAIEAARHMTERDFNELDRRLDLIAKALDTNSCVKTDQADLAFHRYIWDMSGNRTLYKILDQLTVPLFAFVSIVRSRRLEDLKVVTRSHEPIASAIKSGQPEAIEKAIRAHMETSYNRFTSLSVTEFDTLVHQNQAVNS